MKNLIKISITTLGALAILGTNALAITGIVNAPSGLVLRQEADKTANPITTVSDKAEVEIIEKDGEWYKVKYNSQEGYLFAEYVNTENEVVEEPVEEQTTTDDNNVQVNNKLKVYNIPLITSTVINEIEPNAEITIIKQITNWSYISSGEIQGWVRTYGIEGEGQTPVDPSEGVDIEPEEPTEETTEPEEPSISEPETPTVEEPEETITYDDPTNSAQTEKPSSASKGYIAVDSARIRTEATTESDEVETLIKGTSFEIKAETEEWYKIKYTGIDGTVYEGYIYKPLVTVE